MEESREIGRAVFSKTHAPLSLMLLFFLSHSFRQRMLRMHLSLKQTLWIFFSPPSNIFSLLLRKASRQVFSLSSYYDWLPSSTSQLPLQVTTFLHDPGHSWPHTELGSSQGLTLEWMNQTAGSNLGEQSICEPSLSLCFLQRTIHQDQTTLFKPEMPSALTLLLAGLLALYSLQNICSFLLALVFFKLSFLMKTRSETIQMTGILTGVCYTIIRIPSEIDSWTQKTYWWWP